MSDKLTVSTEDLGQRLDKFLAKHFPEHSRSYFQYLIDEDFVLLNGLPVKKQKKLEKGDEVEVTFQLTPQLDVQPEAIDLDVLYEDANLLAINKPAGMVVHPAPGAYTGTFANALLHHCKTLNPEEFDRLRPGIVHRLDKNTTGVLLAAKNLKTHKKLIELFSSRQIEKKYLVVCAGVPKSGEYSAPIKRHPIHRTEMTVSQDGKEAITQFKVLARRQGLSLVEATLITGRTHQIRVHLKDMNCPVLGDPTYGSSSVNKKYGVERQMLHAHSLKLTHPISETSLEVFAPIPPDMKNFIDLIGQA